MSATEVWQISTESTGAVEWIMTGGLRQQTVHLRALEMLLGRHMDGVS